MDLLLLCFQHEKQKMFKTFRFFLTFWWNALSAPKLEAQPIPIQMLRQHATSRQWFMHIAWQAQQKLMDDSLVYLH